MAKYKAYPEYKESGVEWVDSIPSYWDVKPTFALCDASTQKNIDGTESNVLSLSYGNIISRDVETNFGLLPESFNTYQIISFGDVILRLTDLQNDKNSLRVGLAKQRGIITSAYLKLKANSEINTNYLYRLLHSYDTTKVFYGMGGGLRQSMKFEDFRRLPLLLPPYEEQIKISAFLDHETAKIDNLIEKQQQLIELLKEKRQAVISAAVNIRNNERKAKLKNLVSIQTGYPFSSAKFKFSPDNNIPLLRGVNVGVDNIKWDDVVYWDVRALDRLNEYLLAANDIVFGMDRPWISSGARVSEIKEQDLPCLLLQRVARIRSNAKSYQPFIKLCLSSNEFREYAEIDLTGVSVPHISPEQVSNFYVRDIPFDDQVYLTKKTLEQIEKIQISQEMVEQTIQILQERRTALISATVTGKIDVRDWVAPDTQDIEEPEEATA